MHVHWYLRDFLPLFIANGVTGVRQMWGMPLHYAWRQDIEQGTLLGPRMSIAVSDHRGKKEVGANQSRQELVVGSWADS
jgi:hypothetical protein